MLLEVGVTSLYVFSYPISLFNTGEQMPQLSKLHTTHHHVKHTTQNNNVVEDIKRKPRSYRRRMNCSATAHLFSNATSSCQEKNPHHPPLHGTKPGATAYRCARIPGPHVVSERGTHPTRHIILHCTHAPGEAEPPPLISIAPV